jgi:hypothetical protein
MDILSLHDAEHNGRFSIKMRTAAASSPITRVPAGIPSNARQLEFELPIVIEKNLPVFSGLPNVRHIVFQHATIQAKHSSDFWQLPTASVLETLTIMPSDLTSFQLLHPLPTMPQLKSLIVPFNIVNITQLKRAHPTLQRFQQYTNEQSRSNSSVHCMRYNRSHSSGVGTYT